MISGFAPSVSRTNPIDLALCVPLARDEFEAAIVHDDKESKWFLSAQAHLVPDSPRRTQRVRALVQELVKDPSPLICRHALLALCLVDSPGRIRELAGEAVNSMSEEVYSTDDLFNGERGVEIELIVYNGDWALGPPFQRAARTSAITTRQRTNSGETPPCPARIVVTF